jgi:RNA polymerase sigma-70 factor (ECF subfamily)
MDPAIRLQPPIETLFLQHAVSLRGYLFGLLADRAAADDVFQEVFLVVVQRGGDFRRDGNFLAWARGIARNKVREHYRQRRRAFPFDDQLLELLAEAAEQVHDGKPQLDQQREALSRCLDRLAPRARQIVDLRYAEKPLSPPEIAERLSWTTPAVHVALSKARGFLRDCTQHMLMQGVPS